ncbi:triosephosphate isomerase [Enterococcus rotai]|uniref:Triose-phosphate isomerase n=1 Tax=Enterococcus rotai TaxID=118060 RepID=A0A0U2XAM0_9ENTE|nr:triose-phosphate isomerase [Enterococcus rotai]ALS37927.1 triose-phosphate isomerase [Enterococcus rotai]
MAKRTIRAPFFCVNPKAYLYGEEALKLAEKADELAGKYDLDIFFTVQYVDAYRIAQATNHLIITVQHMDGLVVGPGMGYILPEGLVEVGVQATFLNHAEHPVGVNQLVNIMKRAEEQDILVIACADSIAEAKAIALLKPDVMVCEPTELIGTGTVSDLSYMKQTNQAVKSVSPSTFVLQAAGISTVADVRQAIESGADGTGGTSGIVCAQDPLKTLEEMVEEVVKVRAELKEL